MTENWTGKNTRSTVRKRIENAITKDDQSAGLAQG